MLEAVSDCALRLDGRLVITEAATGAYVVTPVLAALAGARVQAFTRDTRYGTVDEVETATRDLAERACVSGRIQIVSERGRLRVEEADLVTNSGHLRPLDAAFVRRMRPGAAIPLMFEAWEFRAADLDLEACREQGVGVAGTNERHPAVDVFSFLGAMAVKLLFDAGVAVHRSRLVVLCDNAFAPSIGSTLERFARELRVLGAPENTPFAPDAVLVATTPLTDTRAITAFSERITRSWPGTAVVQYWGDLDRAFLARRGTPLWPPEPPAPGHMAVLPGDIGPDAIVRLQAGGLKVGEVLLKPERERTAQDLAFLDPL
jgi:hypothetical protein